jgi:hypothetical protein
MWGASACAVRYPSVMGSVRSIASGGSQMLAQIRSLWSQGFFFTSARLFFVE